MSISKTIPIALLLPLILLLNACPAPRDIRFSADTPQITTDASGNKIAVWTHDDGTRYSVYSNRYIQGTGWSTAELIETDNSGDAEHPQIMTDATGNAIAIWTQYNGSNENIWANRYVAGSGWGTATLIETNQDEDAYFPHLAMNSNGNAFAIWTQRDGSNSKIWGNQYNVGTGWGTAEVIGTTNTNSQEAKITTDATGNALVIWYQKDSKVHKLWSSNFTTVSGWSTPELVPVN